MERNRRFPNLHFHEITDLTTIKTRPLKSIDELPQYNDNLSSEFSRLCLPVCLFQSALDEVHEHSQSGLHFAQYNFNPYNQNPFLQKWLSIFIHDCIVCQMHKYKNMKPKKAAILTFSKLSTFLKLGVFLDIKCPLNPLSGANHCVYKIGDLFSNYIVTLQTPNNKAQYVVNSLINHQISKFGPPQCLIAGRVNEYPNGEMANCCTLLKIRHSLRTSQAPWINGLVKEQNIYFGTRLRSLLPVNPESWSIREHFVAYAQNTQA